MAELTVFVFEDVTGDGLAGLIVKDSLGLVVFEGLEEKETGRSKKRLRWRSKYVCSR